MYEKEEESVHEKEEGTSVKSSWENERSVYDKAEDILLEKEEGACIGRKTEEYTEDRREREWKERGDCM